jgi:hypothetical protein
MDFPTKFYWMLYQYEGLRNINDKKDEIINRNTTSYVASHTGHKIFIKSRGLVLLSHSRLLSFSVPE